MHSKAEVRNQWITGICKVSILELMADKKGNLEREKISRRNKREKKKNKREKKEREWMKERNEI